MLECWKFMTSAWALLSSEYPRLRSLCHAMWGYPGAEANMTLALSWARSTVKSYKVTAGVAVIPISGILLDEVPKYFLHREIAATAYSDITSAVNRAVVDPSVKRIHLAVNSPGGIVSTGAGKAVVAIREARQSKFITAHIEDLGASAAYWLASQAEIISAGRNALIGSIGVFMVYTDTSAAYAKKGVKVVLIRSGEHKGIGVRGVKISDKQLAGVQDIVDSISGNSVADIAEGRNRTEHEIQELATGQAWIARAALELGLIDEMDKSPGIDN